MDTKSLKNVIRYSIQIVIRGIPGACILMGVFDIVLGDAYSSLGFIGEKSHGWLFFYTGIVVYLIELFVYFVILRRR
jgi:hypothetical protein